MKNLCGVGEVGGVAEMSVMEMSDKDLYLECRRWGGAALQARNKFLGLLPEVNRRGLYARRGFETIYDFARILAGVSRNQVNRILQLERKFADLPDLHATLVRGEVSVNKLVRVASIATLENQSVLSEKVQKLSKVAVDVFVKEYQNEKCNLARRMDQNGLFETTKAVPGHTFGQIDGGNVAVKNFDFEIINTMSPELKSKIKELIDQGKDINKILLAMFEEREERVEKKMAEVRTETLNKESDKIKKGELNGRYINVKIKKVLDEKFGKKCGALGCGRLAEQVHHEKPFAIYGSHDPQHIRPLCKAHHELAHINDTKVQQMKLKCVQNTMK